jgi:hypothetical protein
MGLISQYSNWLQISGQAVDSRKRQEIFLYSTASRPALGSIKPSIQWVLRALYQGLKQPGREADHSSPFSAEVINVEAIPSLPHMSSWGGDN